MNDNSCLEIVIYTIFVGIVVLIGYGIEVNKCTRRAELMGYPSKFEMGVGCMIQDGDRWIPLEQWYYREEGE